AHVVEVVAPDHRPAVVHDHRLRVHVTVGPQVELHTTAEEAGVGVLARPLDRAHVALPRHQDPDVDPAGGGGAEGAAQAAIRDEVGVADPDQVPRAPEGVDDVPAGQVAPAR